MSMTFIEMLEALTTSARYKVKLFSYSRARYLLASVFAGFYLGFGFFLISTIGSFTHAYGPEFKIYMGVSFGIAISLVLLTKSELFTGNNMVMTAGFLNKQCKFKDLCNIFIFSYLGNFIGAFLIAMLYVYSELGGSGSSDFIVDIAEKKSTLGISTLIIRGFLCNVLICLAVFFFLVLKSETAKLIMIFWCLFAFITSGFEHSIVNMILFVSAKLFSNQSISLSQCLYTVGWISFGNLIGGIWLGFSYYYLGCDKK